MTYTEAYNAIKQHLKAVIAERMYEIQNSDFCKLLDLQTVTDVQVDKAATAALDALLDTLTTKEGAE